MNLLYVWDADYPWDVRTEKICLALTEHGYRVVIAARNLAGRPGTEAAREGLIERMPAGPEAGRRWRSFPAPFNPFWRTHLARVIRKHAPAVIIVRDLPLALTTLGAAAGRAPVILDMAENYPAMVQDIWTDGRQGRLDLLVRNPRIVAMAERRIIARVDHILTVVNESSDRLAAMGVPRERLSVVSNTPPRSRVGGPRVRAPGAPLRLVYLGLMEKHRGILTVLDGAAEMGRTGTAFHLDLVGDGRDLELVRARAATLRLSAAQITFHGRLPHQEAIRVMSAADVGLVPHEARESWNTTIPNKLFDYMAAGLAVITSDAVPAARVVREAGVGLIFRSGDASGLALAVRNLQDMDAWTRCSRAGQDAVRTRYCWEADCATLLEVVDRTARRITPAPPLT